MKKKTIIIPAVLVTLCSTLAGCNPTDTNSEHRTWHAYSTENLLADWDYFDESDEDNAIYLDRDNALRFSSIKNENEAVQLMITPSNYIDSFDFECPDVTGDSGTISKDHFSVAIAYYMNVDFSNERSAVSGLYPDALIPLENYKFRRYDHIAEGFNQSLFINLRTEEDTPAGHYEGVGKLHLDDEVIDIPFEVDVHDVVMPNTNHGNSSYLIWYEQIINGEKRKAGPEMNMKYFEFTVSKRLSPASLPPELTGSINSFVNNYVEKVVRDERITTHRLPISIQNFTEAYIRNLLQTMIDKNLELRHAGDQTIDLFAKAYYYIDDEPAASKFEDVRYHDKTVYDIKKSLSTQLTAYPDLYQSFMGMGNLVTTPYSESLVATPETGGVTIWCPQVQNFQTEENRQIYAGRKAASQREDLEQAWWYVCNDPVMPYPNYHLDAKLITSRQLKYMQYNYGVNGVLNWNMCFFSKWKNNFSGPRDIWNDPIAWENCAGDGYLVYPGLMFGVDGPITTLRLESLLASSEEYEYLWMIDGKVQEYNDVHNTEYVTNELLEKYYSRIYENMISNLDVEAFEEVRLELLNVLEVLYENLDAGMAILLD